MANTNKTTVDSSNTFQDNIDAGAQAAQTAIAGMSDPTQKLIAAGQQTVASAIVSAGQQLADYVAMPPGRVRAARA